MLQGHQHRRQAGPKGRQGPFNIEVFGGSPDDNNAASSANGAMSVLKPRLGKLVIRSKQVGVNKVGILRWDGATAQARMDNLLSAFYGTEGPRRARTERLAGRGRDLLAQGRGLLHRQTEACPVITGQDAEIPSVKAILKG